MHRSASEPFPLHLPLGVPAALFLLGGIGTNTFLALAAILVLQFGLWLLWRPGESPILLFIFFYQWLQASIKIFHANWLGVDVADLASLGDNVQLAIVLSLLGLMALSLGMRLGAGPWRSQEGKLVQYALARYNPKSWFYLYLLALLVASVAGSFAWVIPGLAQPLLALASLKWAFYWMLTCATFARTDTTRQYWLFAFVLEFLLSIGGYFSDFKTVLFFTLFGLAAAGLRLSPVRCVALLSLCALLLYLGVLWTAVKQEYRDFASGGEQAQIVVVGVTERFSKLAELLGELDNTAMRQATEDLSNRLAYVDYFAAVLSTVPRQLPYERGALWWDAIRRPFMPRLFFPEKTSINDSERTNYYTGITVVPDSDQGTSVSLGYMAESYIDFGEVGMMLPVFALGLLLGTVYRWMLAQRDSAGALGMGLATATLYNAAFLELSITKMMGGLAVTILLSWLIMRFVAPRYFPELRSATSR